MKIPLILFGALLLIGCHRSSSERTPSVELDDPPPPHPFSKNPNASPLTQITMTRHLGPEGKAYALTLGQGGSAVFIGEVHAAHQGKFCTTLDPAKFDLLADLVQKSHFTDYDSYFGSADRKSEATTVSILWQGLRKTVVDRGGNEHRAPQALRDLETMIDAAVANAHWVIVRSNQPVQDFSPEYDTIPPKVK